MFEENLFNILLHAHIIPLEDHTSFFNVTNIANTNYIDPVGSSMKIPEKIP